MRAVALGALVFLWSSPLFAQQRAAAEKLFSEAAQLMDQGEFAEACPKLEESQKLDPAGGTVLLLAHCYENAGRTASAWEQFKAAVAFAQRDGRPEREEVASEHAAALEAKLSRIAIDVPPDVEKLPGLQISVDGTEFGQALWGTQLPFDPGTHVVRAGATGYRSAEVTVELGAEKDLKVATIPMLEKGESDVASVGPATPAASTDPVRDQPAPEEDGDGQRLAGWIVGGAGVAVLGVGSVFGIMALSKRSEAEDKCPNSPCTDPDGVDANDTAYTFANVSNVGIGVGLVAIGVGTYLLLTAPEGSSSQARFDPGFRVEPVVSPLGGGVSVGGAF